MDTHLEGSIDVLYPLYNTLIPGSIKGYLGDEYLFP